MEFEKPPTPIDKYSRDARTAIGLKDGAHLILQPTRVVQRKGIEHAIELVRRVGMDAVLVISHASGDEGYEYEQRVREYAELLGVNAVFVQDIIDDQRGTTNDGRKIYSLQDIYRHADMITYPSLQEGFGNAFLEAIYFKKPVLVNNYEIYFYDIKPKGFDVIEMDGFITDATVEAAVEALRDPSRAEEMTDKNYQLGLKYYSYTVLEQNLQTLISNFFGR